MTAQRDFAPKIVRKKDVVWEDPKRPGYGMCRPIDPKIQALLAKFDPPLEGIEYVNREPMFAPVSSSTVTFPMHTITPNRIEKTKPFEGSDDYCSDDDLPDEIGLTEEEKQFPFPLPGESHEDYCSRLDTYYHNLALCAPSALSSNYDHASLLTAINWTKEQKDGRNWTPADVARYIEDNDLTWHERQDCYTMDLVPTEINAFFSHTGGVSIIRSIWNVIDRYMADEAEDADAGEVEAPRRNSSGGFCPLHVILTVALTAGLVVTFLLSDPSALQRLLWFTAVAVPYALLTILCLKARGLPKFLRKRVGGILLLVIFLALLALVPLLTEYLFWVYILVGVWLIIKAVCRFGPTGILTITRHNADGTSSTETRAVYGDMDSAKRRAEDDLRREGYDKID